MRLVRVFKWDYPEYSPEFTSWGCLQASDCVLQAAIRGLDSVMVKTLALFVALNLMACSASLPTKPASGFSGIHIRDVGADQGGEFCKNFTLTNDQVDQYFRLAKEVTFKQLHDQYDYLPCFVKGTLLRQTQACEFSIRAGATAELNCHNDKQFFYVCTQCNNLFIP